MLDPRIKLISTLALVVLTFAAGHWAQLAVLAVVAASALRVVSAHVWLVLRICMTLRWLLLFTLLLHLLFSSGRTLWGIGWLSLDGLQQGVFVCLQMSLAALFTTTLAMTTSVEGLAAAFGWLVRPLALLGCRTDDWQKILLLALGFLPVVHEEITRPGPGETDTGRRRWWDVKAGCSRFVARTEAFVERILARADRMAYQVAADGGACRNPVDLPNLWPLPLLDRSIAAAMLLVILGHWLTG